MREKEQDQTRSNGKRKMGVRERKHANCSLFSYLTDVFVLSAASIHCFLSVVAGH